MQRTNNPLNLRNAHFFFVSIVGLSDPAISPQTQIKKIEALNTLISSCEVFKNADRNSMICSPVGDGMWISFQEGPALPLELAIELHKKLKTHNKGRPPEQKLRIRIGLNDGAVYVAKDVLGNPNLWGPGVILAKRVMDIGDEGHILVSQRMAETLRELSDEYKQLIKPLHDYTIKHGQVMLLYSVYGSGIGNPEIPRTNMSQRSKISTEMMKRKLVMVSNKVDVVLQINDPKTMLTHHKRFHGVQNIGEDAIKTILHGIATDVPKSFLDLNIKVSDEARKNMKITSINLDKPYQKEFTTSFNKPLDVGENDRGYTLEYDVEEPERYFENYFPVNCSKYSMSLTYPSDTDISPVVYDVNVEEETKTKSRIQPVVEKVEDGLVRALWAKKDVLESQAFRLEW